MQREVLGLCGVVHVVGGRAFGGNGHLPPLRPQLPSPLWPALRHAPPPARAARRRSTSSGRPMICGGGWTWAGQYVHADVLGGAGSGRPAQLQALPLLRPQGPLRSVGHAAQTARDGGRALTVVRQRVGLWVSSKVVLAEAVSSAVAHPDLACVGLNADVKFLLQLPAVLDFWAGRPISAPLEHSQLIRDLAGGRRHELTENMRSDPGIFNFVKWLKELYLFKPGWPDTTLVISHSKRMAVNAAANRALAPEGSKLLQLEVIHIDLGETQNGCSSQTAPQNSPQSMRVWPGLRLIGAGGKIPKRYLCGRGGSGAGRRVPG